MTLNNVWRQWYNAIVIALLLVILADFTCHSRYLPTATWYQYGSLFWRYVVSSRREYGVSKFRSFARKLKNSTRKMTSRWMCHIRRPGSKSKKLSVCIHGWSLGWNWRATKDYSYCLRPLRPFTLVYWTIHFWMFKHRHKLNEGSLGNVILKKCIVLERRKRNSGIGRFYMWCIWDGPTVKFHIKHAV